MTETYLKTLARHLVNKDRVAALRLCNRVLKKKALLTNVGKKRFWEQIQFELKKPDPDFAKFEFVRILSSKKISEHDFNHILETYKAKADVLGYSYYDAYYHYRVMLYATELRKNATS